MKELKFRVWVKEDKEMFYFCFKDIYIVQKYKKNTLASWTLENKEKMQYIGRKDNKGKEIYEDDIVKTRWQWCGITNYEFETTGKVFYSKEHAAFRIYIIVKDNFSRPFHDYPNEKLLSMEVIGNTYENPELFKDSKNDT